MTGTELGFYVSYAQNIPGGNDGSDIDFKGSKPGFPTGARAESTADYRIWRFGANYTRVFAQEWQFRAVRLGQYTDDALVSGEQFGYGGPDSVRGFNIRQVANDKGYSSQVEIYTPDACGQARTGRTCKLRVLAFYDLGDYRAQSRPARRVVRPSRRQRRPRRAQRVR